MELPQSSSFPPLFVPLPHEPEPSTRPPPSLKRKLVQPGPGGKRRVPAAGPGSSSSAPTDELCVGVRAESSGGVSESMTGGEKGPLFPAGPFSQYDPSGSGPPSYDSVSVRGGGGPLFTAVPSPSGGPTQSP